MKKGGLAREELLEGHQRDCPSCGCSRSHEIPVRSTVVDLVTGAKRVSQRFEDHETCHLRTLLSEFSLFYTY